MVCFLLPLLHTSIILYMLKCVYKHKQHWTIVSLVCFPDVSFQYVSWDQCEGKLVLLKFLHCEMQYSVNVYYLHPKWAFFLRKNAVFFFHDQLFYLSFQSSFNLRIKLWVVSYYTYFPPLYLLPMCVDMWLSDLWLFCLDGHRSSVCSVCCPSLISYFFVP